MVARKLSVMFKDVGRRLELTEVTFKRRSVAMLMSATMTSEIKLLMFRGGSMAFICHGRNH